jgi:DNA-binding response OmpR family regulator
MGARRLRNRLKILIADDDPAIRKVLTRVLELNDYVVIPTTNGVQALQAFEEHEPQFVILDIRMPELDGLTVCSRIRAESDVPIVILTAVDDESDAADALEAGADDYVRKPFGSSELLARLRAVLRRTMSEQSAAETLQAGDLTIDLAQHLVTYRDQEIYLSRTEFSLLVYLLRNRNRVLTHDQVLEQVWGMDYVGFHHTLRVAVSRLRQRFNDSEALTIESISGVGYRLVTRQAARS